MTPATFEGGRVLGRRAAIAGAAGIVLTAIGALLDLRQALYSYLVAYVFWVGIAVGALLLLMAFHASSAKWPVVLRRILETIPATLPLFLVLFLPVALGMKSIFPWMAPEHGTEAARLWEHRRAWLNVPFFLVRAGVYFGLWIFVGHQLRAWSVRQDRDGGLLLTRWQRRLGAGALPMVALAMTFAAFDWLMSLEADIASTIFGVYWFAGSFLAAIAVVVLATVGARERDLFGAYEVGPDHLHSLGKFLLAHYAFWAYIAFSQWMLTWIANLPHEVPWYLFRDRGGWAGVGIFLVVFHFVIPFFILLSRKLKKSARGLATMAVWTLVVHYVDVYWLVMPRLHRETPRPSWMDLTALVGVGALALAFGLWRARGVALVPVGDPYLSESLRYEPE